MRSRDPKPQPSWPAESPTVWKYETASATVPFILRHVSSPGVVLRSNMEHSIGVRSGHVVIERTRESAFRASISE